MLNRNPFAPLPYWWRGFLYSGIALLTIRCTFSLKQPNMENKEKRTRAPGGGRKKTLPEDVKRYTVWLSVKDMEEVGAEHGNKSEFARLAIRERLERLAIENNLP